MKTAKIIKVIVALPLIWAYWNAYLLVIQPNFWTSEATFVKIGAIFYFAAITALTVLTVLAHVVKFLVGLYGGKFDSWIESNIDARIRNLLKR